MESIRDVMKNIKPSKAQQEALNKFGQQRAEAQGQFEFGQADAEAVARMTALQAQIDAQKLAENAVEFINSVIKLKPQSLKGSYVKSISISSTMSPGISIDSNTVGAAE